MSEANRTFGPWECEEQWHGTAIKVTGSNETVARVSPRADFGREAATARLIAAAPDLLDAAKRCLKEAELYNVPPRQQELDARQDLRRAIDRAERIKEDA